MHRKDIKYNCPICEDKQFYSQGEYYKHLHVKHNLSRKGIKLTDFRKAVSSNSKEKSTNYLEEEEGNETENDDRNDNNDTENRNGEKPKSNSGSVKRKRDKTDDKGCPPRKNTGASGPTSWECPLCEKKYTVESSYYKHLFEKHNIDPQGNRVNP